MDLPVLKVMKSILAMRLLKGLTVTAAGKGQMPFQQIHCSSGGELYAIVEGTVC